MAVETTGYHKQNDIIAHIQAALTAILTDLGITVGNSGWQVLRANQPTIQALQNKSVYYDIISKRRIGTQGTRSKLATNGWVDTTSWYEEYLVQVSAFKQREPGTDTTATLSSSDIIGMIQGCINSNGVLAEKNYFDSSWIQLIKSTEIRELDYETDSGLKEKMPQFDFLLVVGQTLTKSINTAEKIEMNCYRV